MDLNLEDYGFRAVLREVSVRGQERLRLMIEYPPTDFYRARVRQALVHLIQPEDAAAEAEQAASDARAPIRFDSP